MTSSAAPEIVLTLKGRALWRKWRETTHVAQLLAAKPPTRADRLRVRLHAFAPIRRPVFVLGCPRSGTTFLGEVLQAMPTVSYFFEPPALKYYTRLIYQNQVSFAQARRYYRWGLRALLWSAPGKGPRIIEKNPNHTWVAETLLKIFPDARFIVISRDARDTALSLLQKPWHLRRSLESGRREPGGYLYGPYPHFYIEPERRAEFVETSDLHRCIWIWRRHAEEIERLKTALPAAVQHHVHYEDLILQPEREWSGILDFIGERSPAARAAAMDAAREGHSSSIGRWKRILQPADLAVMAREAGALMKQLHYE
ncbi:MAG TPA: sulfotransferase [Opitutaceae bacterium]